MKAKYKTIGKLNANYGAKFGTFDEVTMPGIKAPTPLYYDWTVFNNAYFSEWHAWMAGIVKKLAPNVPVSAKMMANLSGVTSYGVDPEQFDPFADLNGGDNWNYLGSGASGFIRENRFYDLQASFRKAPVFNAETHLIMGPEHGFYAGSSPARVDRPVAIRRSREKRVRDLGLGADL